MDAAGAAERKNTPMKIQQVSVTVLLGVLASLLSGASIGCTNGIYHSGDEQWLWVSGSNTVGTNGGDGIYGTQGVPSFASVPPTRDSAVGWTDRDGNFWLFGGEGYSPSGPADNLNDLWELDVDAQTWIWMGGADTSNAVGVYGAQGVTASTNVPGSRHGAVSWTDARGNLWLFGGDGNASTSGVGVLNDLWRFNIASQTWVWMSGANAVNASGVYGTQGVAATTNVPGARQAAVSWTDGSGNLWLFGGQDTDTSPTQGYLNDLWEFNPTAQVWIWVSGSNTVGAKGVYGTQGVPATTNVPGARISALSWTDSSGNLWLFGGSGYDSTGAQGYLNDLWEFNPATKTWTWVSGANTVGAKGVYGTQGMAAATNVPGARAGAVSWIDVLGNLWLFGGTGYDSTGAQGYLGDLWMFNPAAQTWTWVNGANTVGAMSVYGTEGVPAVANAPGNRAGAVSWMGVAGDLWLFGGLSSGNPAGTLYDHNDLWAYQP